MARERMHSFPEPAIPQLALGNDRKGVKPSRRYPPNPTATVEQPRTGHTRPAATVLRPTPLPRRRGGRRKTADLRDARGTAADARARRPSSLVLLSALPAFGDQPLDQLSAEALMP